MAGIPNRRNVVQASLSKNQDPIFKITSAKNKNKKHEKITKAKRAGGMAQA
jgi:hypothetical protein